MKWFLLFLLTFVVCSFLQAQDLRVVKDNINCTYGIKDGEGNWVVQPTYILIEEYNSGYFRMQDEIGLGVLTPGGKELIPCVHDQIKISTHNWYIQGQYEVQFNTQSQGKIYFYGMQGDDCHVYNLEGTKLTSFSRNCDFELDTDFSIIGYDRYLTYSKYVDSNGIVLIDSIDGKLAAYKGKNYSVVGDNVSSNGRVTGNARVINRKGELLMKSTVDQLQVDSKERICFTINKRFGVLSMSGDTILHPRYERLDGILNLDDVKIWPIYDDEHRAGLMNNEGRVLVKPKYDKVYRSNVGNQFEVTWTVEKDGSYGIIDSRGTELIPSKYDQIYPILFRRGNSQNIVTRYIGRDKEKHYYLDPWNMELSLVAYDSVFLVNERSYSSSRSLTLGIITKKNGKYGVLNSDGSEVTKCIYDVSHMLYRSRYLMGDGDDITEYTFSRSGIEKSEWSPAAIDGELRIYSNSIHNYIAVNRLSGNGQTIRVNEKLKNFQRKENLLMVQHVNTREWLFFNIKTKKRLPLKNIINIRNNNRGQYAISTRLGHHGIIDTDANLIVDTIYTNIGLNQRSTKIWATKVIGNRHVSILLDSVGRQVLPNQFDNTFEINSGDQVVSQNQRKGVIDSKTLKWKIRPKHLCLIKLFEDYYYVGDEFNKKGIIRANGNVILPTEYDTISLLYSNCPLNGGCPADEATKIRWIVEKGNTQYLADQDGKLVNSRSVIRSFKESLLFDDDTLLGVYNQYRSFPVLDYSPSLHFLRGLTINQIQNKRKALWKNSVLRNEVLDTINKFWLAQKNNNCEEYLWNTIIVREQEAPKTQEEKARRSCDCLQANRYSWAENGLIYQLSSIGTQFVTIDISYKNINGYWDPMRSQAPPLIPANSHLNIVEDNGKARYVSLKEIFPDEDILMQEFIISLKERDDLQLECSSLENMLEMINGNFSLSDEGVILYLNQYNVYSNSQVELLIPLENLSKLPASKWIVPFLKN